MIFSIQYVSIQYVSIQDMPDMPDMFLYNYFINNNKNLKIFIIFP